MATNGNLPRKLTARQRRAIAALLSSPDTKAAAAAAKVGARTLYRWMAEDPLFKAALSQAEDQAIDQATRLLIAGADLAAVKLRHLAAGAQSEAVQRQAASDILSHIMKLQALRAIVTRLEELERTAYVNRDAN